jgi:hypothetical protein
LFLCGTWGEKKVLAGWRRFPEFVALKKSHCLPKDLTEPVGSLSDGERSHRCD